MDSEPPSHRSTPLATVLVVLSTVIAVIAVAADPDPVTQSGSNARTAALLTLGTLSLLAGALFSVVRTALGAHAPEDEEESRPNGFFAHTDPDWLSRDRIFDRSCSAAALGLNIVGAFLAIDFGSRAFGSSPLFGSFLAGFVVIALQFFFVDVLLLNQALRHPRGVLRVCGWLAFLLSYPLRPLAHMLVNSSSATAQPQTSERYRYVRTREMRLLPHVRGVDRLVEEEAVEMIDSVREFTESTARDIMTPRTEIEGVPLTTEYDDLIRQIQETPYSRLVVYEENLDHIVGVLLAKEILLNRPQNPFDLMRAPLNVPLTMRLPELLAQLRNARTYLAVVIDDYGGTAGIVTLHDLFEQVIGAHIEDEEEEEELWIEIQPDESARLSGRVEVWEVNEELDLDLDESVARTLGGYLMYRFGRLPNPGDEWPVNKGVFRVETIDTNRIEVIAYRRDPAARESIESEQESLT